MTSRGPHIAQLKELGVLLLPAPHLTAMAQGNTHIVCFCA